jgi:O-antigen ligase
MVNIYNFLNNVWQKAKEELLNNPFVVLISLVLITIPLHYRYNNSAIILLSVFSLSRLYKRNFFFHKALVLPVLLYLLMVFSLFWSIDFKMSLQALSKEIAFILIPICFALNPPLTKIQIDKVIQIFSYTFLGYTIFYLIQAIIRYSTSKDINVFFYHELVSFDVNAIHVSVYVSVAFFYFFLKTNKLFIDKLALILVLIFIVLLSSKNIIVVFLLLLGISTFLILKIKWNLSKITLIILALILFGFGFYGKLKDRFLIEIETNNSETIINNEISNSKGFAYNVSIKDAWNKEQFQPNDYFPGTALRVYQARIFCEMLKKDTIFVKGYGLNAAQGKIIQKRKEHNLYFGYDNFNFHNQYIQIFAELGVVGLLLLLLIVGLNLKNAINNKDFIHFSFAILMISLFLTESFLSRQRGIVFFVMMYCLFNIRVKK